MRRRESKTGSRSTCEISHHDPCGRRPTFYEEVVLDVLYALHELAVDVNALPDYERAVDEAEAQGLEEERAGICWIATAAPQLKRALE